MTELFHDDPIPGNGWSCDQIKQVIVPSVKDLGGFSVRRALPSVGRKMIGPFIFFDQMGPAEFVLGQGIDVRPHPHIGLSTVTYLFDGEIYHRDSLGSALAIRPGEVNLMTAGRVPSTTITSISIWPAMAAVATGRSAARIRCR